MTDNPNLAYHQHIGKIAENDINYVRKKDAQYDASWKRRGGPGAWFTIVRPWDRLSQFMERPKQTGTMTHAMVPVWERNDIIGAMVAEKLSGEDGTVTACVRDLRRYLLLLEAEVQERISEGCRRWSESLVAAAQSKTEELESLVNAIAYDRAKTPAEVVDELAAALARRVPPANERHEFPAPAGGGPVVSASGSSEFSASAGVGPIVFTSGSIEFSASAGGDPTVSTSGLSEIKMPTKVDDVLPLYVGFPVLMQMSADRQLLYSVHFKGYRLDEHPAAATVLRQSPEVRARYIVEVAGCGFAMLDRRCYASEVDDYLLRHPFKLNEHDYASTPPETRILYERRSDADGYTMRPEFVEMWAHK